jgi:hypothetical protein
MAVEINIPPALLKILFVIYSSAEETACIMEKKFKYFKKQEVL